MRTHTLSQTDTMITYQISTLLHRCLTKRFLSENTKMSKLALLSPVREPKFSLAVLRQEDCNKFLRNSSVIYGYALRYS